MFTLILVVNSLFSKRQKQNEDGIETASALQQILQISCVLVNYFTIKLYLLHVMVLLGTVHSKILEFELYVQMNQLPPQYQTIKGKDGLWNAELEPCGQSSQVQNHF